MTQVNFDTAGPYPFKRKPPDASKTEKALCEFAHHLLDHMPFSGVLAIQAGEKLIVNKAFNPVGAAFTTDQVFNCFSTGKIFTAVAAMQLVEDGQLELDASLNKYLSVDEVDLALNPPYLKDKPEENDIKKLQQYLGKITVRDLLNHTSGLVQVRGGPEKFLEQLPEHSEQRPYSNYGYQLLARIIGKQTKNSTSANPEDRFRDHVIHRIFYPAGMKIRSASIPAPYTIDPQDNLQLITELPEPEPYPHGNGCWKVTSNDLIAFSNALHKPGMLIRKDSFDQMLHSNPPLGFKDVDFNDKNNVVGYGNPGRSIYGTAFLFTFVNQETPVTVAVLSNCPSGIDIKPAIEELLSKLT